MHLIYIVSLFQNSTMARVRRNTKPCPKNIEVMVKLLKLKMKKVSVNLKSLKIERWQTEALSDQRKAPCDHLIVVKVVDDNLTEAEMRTYL